MKNKSREAMNISAMRFPASLPGFNDNNSLIQNWKLRIYNYLNGAEEPNLFLKIK